MTDNELDSIDMDAKAIANQNPIGTPFAWRKAYLVAFARAVLAKWGQPTPPAVVEPLTDEQIVGVMHSIPINAAPSYHIAFARAIEQAHGIKGGQHGTE